MLPRAVEQRPERVTLKRFLRRYARTTPANNRNPMIYMIFKKMAWDLLYLLYNKNKK